MRALLAVLCLAEAAHAETLDVTSATWGLRIARVAVAIHAAPEPTFVVLDAVGKDGTITLDVPAGTQIVGLGVDSATARVWGRPHAPAPARLLHDANGGALVAWETEERVTIALHPPATIELALHLPPLAELAITTDALALAVDVAGERIPTRRRHVVVQLSDVAGTTGALAMPHVAQDVSLVAAPTPIADFTPARDARAPALQELDKAIIRRRLGWFRPTLLRCYQREAQWDGANNVRPIRGGAVLSFLIVETGSVEWARTSESDLPAKILDCLVEQILAWEFPRSSGRVVVNYPVTFDLLGW